MKKQEIMELMESFNNMQLSKMEYECNGERILFEKQYSLTATALPNTAIQSLSTPSLASNSIPQLTVAQETTPSYSEVKSPLVGVFYHAPSPNDKPFVAVGDKVAKGQVICLIEAMKMISELPSPLSGVIKSISVKNEDVVSFGQVLFEVDPC